MFEMSPRRHPLQTTQFWFLLLLCGSALVAWKLDLLSFSQQRSVAVLSKDDFMPPPPEDWELDAEGAGLAPLASAPHLESPAPLPARSRTASIPSWARPAPGGQSEATAPPSDVQPASAVTTAADNRVVAARLEHVQEDAPPAAQPSASADEIDLDKIDALIDASEDVRAHRLLSTWYWMFPQRRPELMDRLNLLSRRIYFQPQPHYLDPYRVEFGDRLETIGKQYSVPWEYLARLNRTEPERIRVGQTLKVIQGPFHAVVDLHNFELTVHAHGYYVTRFPVGVGHDDSTPLGSFRIVDKVVNPKYYGPDGVIAADDPQNPLGERWLAISDERGALQGYGIHGTIDPDSIGKAESRGCIRLRNDDVAELYDLLTIGSEVVIRR